MVLEGDTFDYCGGHATEKGDYHYHVPPSCLLAQMGADKLLGVAHTPQIGWALDGFPVYGPFGPHGTQMKVCGETGANASSCLDECNGLYGWMPELDDFVYRYYMTGPISDLETNPTTPLPDTTYYPYTPLCLKGCYRGSDAPNSIVPACSGDHEHMHKGYAERTGKYESTEFPTPAPTPAPTKVGGELNFVDNGGFESGSTTTSYSYTTPAGWTTSANRVVYIYSGNSAWGSTAAVAGSYFIALQDPSTGGGTATSITQEVGDLPAGECRLTFKETYRTATGVVPLRARVADGNNKTLVMFNTTDASTSWTSHDIVFNVSATDRFNVTVTFENAGDHTADKTLFLDEIHLYCPVNWSPTPVPTSVPSAASSMPTSIRSLYSYGTGGSSDGTMSVCEGDCDSDDDCTGDLLCFLRSDSTAVPGCESGGDGDISGYDYCFDREIYNTALLNHGSSGSSDGTMGLCEGDCDSDDDCTGDLQCFFRDDTTPVPGCLTGGDADESDYDFCYNASDATGAPSALPTTSSAPSPLPSPLPTPMPTRSFVPTPSPTLVPTPSPTLGPTPSPSPVPSPLPTWGAANVYVPSRRNGSTEQYWFVNASEWKWPETDNTTVDQRVACKIKNLTSTSLWCETGAYDWSPAHAPNATNATSSMAHFKADMKMDVKLSHAGDMLRVVSQGKYTSYKDDMRPGLYIVTQDTHVEYFVEGSDCRSSGGSSGDGDTRICAGYYDPATRTVVRTLSLYGYDTAARRESMIDFIKSGRVKHLFFIVSRYWNLHGTDEALVTALESCGASDTIFTSDSSDQYERKSYILLGQCNAGLSRGYSASVGMEGKGAYYYHNLELETDPLSAFNVGLDPATGDDAASTTGASTTTWEYSYSEALTPRVYSISRLNGTTAGGTTVMINGTGFGNNATTDVFLAGIRCAVTYEQIGSYRGQHLCEWDGVDCTGLRVSESSIVCLTNKWDYNGDAFEAAVTVTVEHVGTAVVASGVSWSYMNLWSSKTTWGGNDPPAAGDSVVITYGEYIVLDESPAELHLLTLQGTLEFSRDVGDLQLNCR